MELAQLIHARGEDFDAAAVAHYRAALTAHARRPAAVPRAWQISFDARSCSTKRSKCSKQATLDALADGPADVRLWQELGLTHADLPGTTQQASDRGWSAWSLHFSRARSETDLPPEGTLRLAALYERRPDGAVRALDLYSMLARGSDRPNLHLYHMEAARLMKTLGSWPAEGAPHAATRATRARAPG